MAQRTQFDDVSNPLHEAYACLLANGLDGAGEALLRIPGIVTDDSGIVTGHSGDRDRRVELAEHSAL